MYKRTPLGDSCKHLLDKDENICKHSDNKQPTSIGYSENGCRYSYCPLKDKHYCFGDVCPRCDSKDIRIVKVNGFTVDKLPYCSKCKTYTTMFNPIRRSTHIINNNNDSDDYLIGRPPLSS